MNGIKSNDHSHFAGRGLRDDLSLPLLLYLKNKIHPLAQGCPTAQRQGSDLASGLLMAHVRPDAPSLLHMDALTVLLFVTFNRPVREEITHTFIITAT